MHELAESWRTETSIPVTPAAAARGERTPRIAQCGRIRHSSDVEIRQHPSSYRASGLIRCRSKACAVCIAERRAAGAELVTRTAQHWVEWRGQSLYLATFTVRHGWQDTLEQTALGIRKAWNALLGGRPWRRMRKRFGFELIINHDLTHGSKNGWHPHIHVLFCAARPLSETEVLETADWLFEKWCELVERHIGEAYVPSADHGLDFKPFYIRPESQGPGEYLCKLGLELSDPGNKRAKGGGATPMQLLERWHQDRDPRARALYREYESTLQGMRELTWSRGLGVTRNLAAVELKNERQAERDASPVVCTLEGTLWDAWRYTRCALPKLLEAVELGGVEAARDLLEHLPTTERGPPRWRVFGPS